MPQNDFGYSLLENGSLNKMDIPSDNLIPRQQHLFDNEMQPNSSRFEEDFNIMGGGYRNFQHHSSIDEFVEDSKSFYHQNENYIDLNETGL